MAKVLFDLLTPAEEANRANVFDIPFLANRVVDAVDWVGASRPSIHELRLGLFGASTSGGDWSWPCTILIKSQRLAVGPILLVRSLIRFIRQRS